VLQLGNKFASLALQDSLFLARGPTTNSTTPNGAVLRVSCVDLGYGLRFPETLGNLFLKPLAHVCRGDALDHRAHKSLHNQTFGLGAGDATRL
jgi:hypothetical protein